MARRVGCDPESLLRAHFTAEIAAERLEARLPPRLEPGSGDRESHTETNIGSLRDARQGPVRAWPRELATAAVLVLAFGLGAWKAPTENGLTRAMAKRTFEDGRAREVGTVICRGVSAAIVAYSRSVLGGSEADEAPLNTRFE